MFGIILANNIIIPLCLYQMVTADSGTISIMRYFKFIAELIATLMQYYFMCNASEMADDCHGALRTALVRSRWDRCSYGMRRDLLMLVRQAQRPNYMSFYNGAIVLSRVQFSKVVKVAYTFINFMRTKDN
ncbi:hypothetical protein WDU94_008636 [Cyamophila willieti]